MATQVLLARHKGFLLCAYLDILDIVQKLSKMSKVAKLQNPTKSASFGIRIVGTIVACRQSRNPSRPGFQSS